ncbi:MAG: hypothetical protein K2W96_16585 [Gemmataceae bacterium]|nr:hypothetical protein [Gemmataceae bacterium]
MLVLILLAAPADEAQAALSSLARERILAKLAKPLEIKHPLFSGTLALYDPKSLEVAVSALSLRGDDATAKASITGEWSLAGKLKLGEKTAETKLRVKCRLDAAGGGRVVFRRGRFLVRPLVADLALASVEATAMEPEPFFGAKLALPALAATLLKANKDAILKDIAALPAVELPQPALLGEKGGTNDNAVLRLYAASMLATRLSKFGSEKEGFAFDEKTPFLDVSGKLWLDPRGLKARIVRLDVRDGVAYVGGVVEAPLRGACRFEAAGLVEGETDIAAGLRVEFDGDAELKGGKPGGCNVYRLRATLAGFEAGAAAFRPVKRALDGLVARLAEAKSAEARAKIEEKLGGPSRARLVESAYRRVVGRAPDAEGVRGWTAFLERKPPRDLLAALASSDEYEKGLKGKDAETMARELRKLVLAREPGADEVASSAAWLRERETVYEERVFRLGPLRRERRKVAVGARSRTSRDLLGVLVGSEEYEARFGAGLPR